MPKLYSITNSFNFLSYTFLKTHCTALYCTVQSSTCWGRHYNLKQQHDMHIKSKQGRTLATSRRYTQHRKDTSQVKATPNRHEQERKRNEKSFKKDVINLNFNFFINWPMVTLFLWRPKKNPYLRWMLRSAWYKSSGSSNLSTYRYRWVQFVTHLSETPSYEVFSAYNTNIYVAGV
jgi:hypothetical protein